jgi:catechol 2,3-dioxygenase-like lactoylglutathione lyase family enzyme
LNFELQLVGVPVSDVDRAIGFYTEKAGFHLDVDVMVREGLRFVQLTPPGSACSICIGVGITDEMAPGSLRNLQLVVTDIEEARAELAGRGMEVSEVDVQPWGSFVYFRDPDGNAWSVQQLPPRG